MANITVESEIFQDDFEAQVAELGFAYLPRKLVDSPLIPLVADLADELEASHSDGFKRHESTDMSKWDISGKFRVTYGLWYYPFISSVMAEADERRAAAILLGDCAQELIAGELSSHPITHAKLQSYGPGDWFSKHRDLQPEKTTYHTFVTVKGGRVLRVHMSESHIVDFRTESGDVFVAPTAGSLGRFATKRHLKLHSIYNPLIATAHAVMSTRSQEGSGIEPMELIRLRAKYAHLLPQSY